MRVRSLALVFALMLFAHLAAPAVMAQTSLGGSLVGQFTSSTSGNGTLQHPANQMGGLFEFRHASRPLFQWGASYLVSRANQTYVSTARYCPAWGCDVITESVPNVAHAISADWVPQFKVRKLRPFGLLGMGLLVEAPTAPEAAFTSQGPCFSTFNTFSGIISNCPSSGYLTYIGRSATKLSTKALYTYGGGGDWLLRPHVGLRFEYRGMLYSAPNLTTQFFSTKSFTHAEVPAVGAFYKF